MKINEQKGTVVFNTAELDKNTLEICKLWLADSLKRYKTSEIAKTKKQTEINILFNNGFNNALHHLETLQKHSKDSRNIEIWNA